MIHYTHCRTTPVAEAMKPRLEKNPGNVYDMGHAKPPTLGTGGLAWVHTNSLPYQQTDCPPRPSGNRIPQIHIPQPAGLHSRTHKYLYVL
ncbi:hypothetical protein MRX96_009408 [Rhipicephalus microplus]